jgi:cytochrome c556
MKLAMAMRDEASNLARRTAARDHAGSKAALAKLTDSCNRCHQTFRVKTRVGPEAEKPERDAE